MLGSENSVSHVADGYDPAIFEEIAELEPQSWWFRSRNGLVERVARRHFAGAKRVLEIGAGTGYTLEALARAVPDAELVGTELFEEGLAVARRRLPDITLVQADARALPFGQEFDLVGAFDVLEHIDDDVGVLHELARVLRPGGGVLITVPQHKWLWSAADEFAKHERRYTRRVLVDRLRIAGFAIERVTSFVTLLTPLMLLSRLRHRTHYELRDELLVPRPIDRTFETVCQLEQRAIQAGVSLPFGGSLLVVARLPASFSSAA
ncbi:MAG TPA: class I SAM-dependent methyltransferase [Methylomirabilota bacterium]